MTPFAQRGSHMGVITDYCRAPDAKTAIRAMEMDESDDSLGPPLTVDIVQAKGIDPTVVLGQVVAFIRGVSWDPDLVSSTLVWPPLGSEPLSKAAFDALPDESPLKSGPWLEELGAPVRDTLAAVDDARLPALADQWARVEEFHGLAEAGQLLAILSDLVALARRARHAGDRLYCLTCL